jgi:hypothetical protein
MIADPEQPSSCASKQTLYEIRLARGATPDRVRFKVVVGALCDTVNGLPTAVLATWVPWPPQSLPAGVVESKLQVSLM